MVREGVTTDLDIVPNGTLSEAEPIIRKAFPGIRGSIVGFTGEGSIPLVVEGAADKDTILEKLKNMLAGVVFHEPLPNNIRATSVGGLEARTARTARTARDKEGADGEKEEEREPGRGWEYDNYFLKARALFSAILARVLALVARVDLNLDTKSSRSLRRLRRSVASFSISTLIV